MKLASPCGVRLAPGGEVVVHSGGWPEWRSEGDAARKDACVCGNVPR